MCALIVWSNWAVEFCVFESLVCRSYLIRTALRISQGKIRLLFHAVQIFMKSIQQEGQKLLGILLLVAWELRSETPNLCLGGKKTNKHKSFGYFKLLGGASSPGLTGITAFFTKSHNSCWMQQCNSCVRKTDCTYFNLMRLYFCCLCVDRTFKQSFQLCCTRV